MSSSGVTILTGILAARISVCGEPAPVTSPVVPVAGSSPVVWVFLALVVFLFAGLSVLPLMLDVNR